MKKIGTENDSMPGTAECGGVKMLLYVMQLLFYSERKHRVALAAAYTAFDCINSFVVIL